MATAGSSSSNSNSEMVPNRIFVGGIPLDVNKLRICISKRLCC